MQHAEAGNGRWWVERRRRIWLRSQGGLRLVGGTDTAGETAEKTLAIQSSALGEGGCCSLSRPSDDLKIS